MSPRLQTPLHLAAVTLLVTLGAFAQDQYLVKVTGNVNQIARSHGLTVVRSLTGSAAGHHVLKSQGTDPRTVLHSLSLESVVASAQINTTVRLPGVKPAGQVHAGACAHGTSFSSILVRYYNSYASSAYVGQPATDIINMDKAHNLAIGEGIVATIDTGVDFSHSVLRNSLTPGFDFVNSLPLGQERADVNQETTPILDQETTPILDQETTPILDGGTAVILQQETTPILDQETTPILDAKKYPAYGHGTAVAGLIHLVAPGARIMPVRAFAADGSATLDQIVAAIHYAVDHGARVINMSFSVKQAPDDALTAAVNYAVAHGVICVASAGNDSSSQDVWPAAYANVIGVASTNNSMSISTFSNFGAPLVSVAAPGEGVITTYPAQHYAQVCGTSFSAPLVSGAASLLLDRNSKTTPAMAAADLSNTVKGSANSFIGAGELDLFQAVTAAKRRNQ